MKKLSNSAEAAMLLARRRITICAVTAAIMLLGLSIAAQANSLYVSNGGDGSVKVIDMSGAVSTYATGFSTPRGLAFDGNNFLYVACAGDSTIRKVSPGGLVSTFASGLSGDLYGLAFHAGYVYVASTNYSETDDWIFRFAADGSMSTFANSPLPGGLVFDGDGNLFVTISIGDHDGGINKIDSAGSVSLFASGLANPIGLTRDATSGDLYAADFSAPNKIRRVATDGSVYDFASGVGIPYGLAFGEDGFLYAADFAGGTINKIDSSGNVSPFVGGLSSPRFMVSGPNVVPEPATICLLGLGALSLVRRKR